MPRYHYRSQQKTCVKITPYGLPPPEKLIYIENISFHEVKIRIIPPEQPPYRIVGYRLERYPEFFGLPPTVEGIGLNIPEFIDRIARDREYEYTVYAVYDTKKERVLSEPLIQTLRFGYPELTRYTCSFTWRMRYGGGKKDGRGQSFTYELRGTIFTKRELLEIEADGCFEYVHPAVAYWFQRLKEDIEVAYPAYWRDESGVHHNKSKTIVPSESDMINARGEPIVEDILYIDYMIAATDRPRSGWIDEPEGLGMGFGGIVWFKRIAAIHIDSLEHELWDASEISSEYEPRPHPSY